VGHGTPSETGRAQGGEVWATSMNPQGIVLPLSKVRGIRVLKILKIFISLKFNK
jgi:hypothetical protein